jgi:hypothetical protein
MSPKPTPPDNSQLNKQNDSINSTNVELIEGEEVEIVTNQLVTENGDTNYDAYDLLPHEQATNDSNDEGSDSDSDSDEDDIDPDLEFEHLASYRATKPVKTSSESLLPTLNLLETDVFKNRQSLECEDISIDDNKSREITNLMSDFKIPEQNVPQWAKEIPEDLWKRNLISTLNCKKVDLFKNDDNSKK